MAKDYAYLVFLSLKYLVFNAKSNHKFIYKLLTYQ
jgi:hypothetical protein